MHSVCETGSCFLCVETLGEKRTLLTWDIGIVCRGNIGPSMLWWTLDVAFDDQVFNHKAGE